MANSLFTCNNEQLPKHSMHSLQTAATLLLYSWDQRSQHTQRQLCCHLCSRKTVRTKLNYPVGALSLNSRAISTIKQYGFLKCSMFDLHLSAKMEVPTYSRENVLCLSLKGGMNEYFSGYKQVSVMLFIIKHFL